MNESNFPERYNGGLLSITCAKGALHISYFKNVFQTITIFLKQESKSTESERYTDWGASGYQSVPTDFKRNVKEHITDPHTSKHVRTFVLF